MHQDPLAVTAGTCLLILVSSLSHVLEPFVFLSPTAPSSALLTVQGHHVPCDPGLPLPGFGEQLGVQALGRRAAEVLL